MNLTITETRSIFSPGPEDIREMLGIFGGKAEVPPPPPPTILESLVDMSPEVLAAVVAANVALLCAIIGKKGVGSILMHVLGLVLIIIDLALWAITGGPLVTLYKNFTARTVFAKPHSEVMINGKNMPGSKVWRSVEAIAAGKLEDGTRGGTVKTIYDLLSENYKQHASLKAQGTRPLLSWRAPDPGFKFPAKEFGTTTWRSYGEMGELAHAFGAGLRALGMSPQAANAMTVDHSGVLIYDETSADWMVCAQGAISQNIVVATSYATLGADAVVKTVVQGGVQTLVCNRKTVGALLKEMGSMPTVKNLIYTDTLCTPEESKVAVPSSTTVKILSFAEVIAMGKATPCAPTPPKAESLCVIMYTSGSTGDPKGVMIQHKHLLAMVDAVTTQLGRVLGPAGTEVYLGYLPLAHILELVSEFYYFAKGNTVGYADPKSLTTGPERAYPHGGLEEFKPTLMCGVPKVWEAIRVGAMAKVEKAGALAKFLISLAVRMKALGNKQYRKTPLFNVLLKKFKATTGGRLKCTLSGGGAISAEVQEWCRTALDCPLVQGYGLTETTGGATIQMPDDMSIGIAGTPLSSVEVTLHSELEITDADNKPYLATDTVHSTGAPCAGRGEVWLRGVNVSAGYYKMAALTGEDFDKDGWFHTGDIGMLTPGGAIKIIDRKKNLVKLKGGEYVALERMNTAYNASPYVNVEMGGTCCFADDSLDRVVAIMQMKPTELAKLAKELDLEGKDDNALCKNDKVQAKVLDSFKAAAKTAKLVSLETVVAVLPVTVEWSTLNGCLTATQKLVPKKVFAFHAKELEELKKKGRRG